MIRMYVRHAVGNYRTWRNAYDAFNAERRKMGVVGHGVYQAVDNPKDVTVYHDFKTRKRAESFAASPRLKEVMKNAGVTGRPSIWFVKESKKPAVRRKTRSKAAPAKSARAKSRSTSARAKSVGAKRRSTTARARAARK